MTVPTAEQTYYCFTCDAMRLHHAHPERVLPRKADGSYKFPQVTVSA